MLSINTNISSLITQSSMKQSTDKLNQAIERMTTGFKINHASDNAANYSISTNMTTKINSYMVAEDNASMGLDLISTADGTLNQIQDKLGRLRALQEQASNGTYGEQSLNAINAEANALVDEINRLYTTAEYNGLKLFGGTAAGGADGVSAALTDETSPIQTFALARTVTVDESKRVSNVSSFTAGETYYITKPEDLVALQNLVNNEFAETSDVTFELTNSINMEGIEFSGIGGINGGPVCFKGVFNGNGHAISNLTIDGIAYLGLFSLIEDDAVIVGVNLINCNISGTDSVGGIVGSICPGSGTGSISDSIVTGSVSGNDNIGGIVGISEEYSNVMISNVQVFANIQGNTSCTGGIIGSRITDSNEICVISNSAVYSESLSINNNVFIGHNSSDGSVDIQNCIYNASLTLNEGSNVTLTNVSSTGNIPEPPKVEDFDYTPYSGVSGGTTPDPLPDEPTTSPSYASDTLILQIGTSSDWASQVGVSTKFELEDLEDLRMIGLDSTTDYLTQIDDMLALVREKQTHFGAVSNRLESVLEEIIIQRDNLISSRSTIRDADIAEASSHYIQQQILQQASATLLATANQSPSIALQLI